MKTTRTRKKKVIGGLELGLAALLLVGLSGVVRTQDGRTSTGPSTEVPTNAIKYNSGQTIQPVFEGWTRNDDGTFSFWFGYMNRNWKETPDIPVGPNNGFGAGQSGAEDMGQPTRFKTRRADSVFKVTVPADWPKDRDLVWTIVVGGQAMKAYGTLWPVWEIEQNDAGIRKARLFGDPDNRPPRIMSGTEDKTATVGQPLTLTLRVTDDGIPKPSARRGGGGGGGGAAAANPNAPAARAGGAGAAGAPAAAAADPAATPAGQDLPDTPNPNPQGLRVVFTHWRGPDGATVRFSPGTAAVLVDKKPHDTDGIATTNVTFDKPGAYVIRAVANDRQSFQGINDIKVQVK